MMKTVLLRLCPNNFGSCPHRRQYLRLAHMSSRSKLWSTVLCCVIISCITNCCHCHEYRKTELVAAKSTIEPVAPSDDRFFLQNIFGKYGVNGTMTFEAFEHLLESLGILHKLDHGLKDHKDGNDFLFIHPNHEHSKSSDGRNQEEIVSQVVPQDEDHDPSHPDHHEHEEKEQKMKKKCLTPKEMYMTFNMEPGKSLNPTTFSFICPAIIYELDQCQSIREEDTHKDIQWEQWLYAVIAVVIISLCGLFSVIVIPIMQKWFYHTLLQFLVGLAIGSLSGDALLHLLPHAMVNHGSDDHHDGHDDPQKEMTAIWTGFCGLAGIYIFFITERGLSAITTYRRQRRMKRLQQKAESIAPFGTEEVDHSGNNVGEKLSQYRKNSYNSQVCPDAKESAQMLPEQETNGGINSRRGSRRSSHEVAFHGRSSFSTDPLPKAFFDQAEADPEKFTVTISDHHGHGHGHSHEVPDSISAVAWMVIMGDGLHNFCDGIAIGAAFATSVGDGISTTVAVFCHELPHELGDFAMLLKTGMKVKQALLYNLLSSVLCFIGVVIGVSLGSLSSATVWIFAGTAGMFLYIALVDMLPELVTATDNPTSTVSFTLAVQVLGITLGVSIMLLIALFEDALKTMVS